MTVSRCTWNVVLLGCCLALTACADQTRQDFSASEVRHDSLYLAAAWSWGGRGAASYGHGVQLALDQINEAGGVLGRPLAVHRVDDEESIQTARRIAKAIASTGRYSGVIGHLHSDISLAAAAIYSEAGMLMITPASTAPRLTERGLPFVFRLVNSDAVTAAQLAAYAEEKGFRRVAVCYVRSDYGAGLSNSFERYASGRGISVLDRLSYEASGPAIGFLEHRFRDWTQLNLDAIVLAATAPSAAQVVRAMRAVGLDQPIIGGDGLDDQEFLDRAGASAEGLTVVTMFHPDDPDETVVRFRTAFSSRYGMRPDSWAARGYEGVHILAATMNGLGSTASAILADGLRARNWQSLTGSISFDDRGEPRARPGILVRAIDGNYQFVRQLSVSGPFAPEPYQPISDVR